MGKFRPYDSYKTANSEWVGQIPQHWASAATKRYFRIVNGATPASSVVDYWDGDIVWITPEDLGQNKAVTISDSRRHITSLGLANCGAGIVPPGSLVVSSRAPIGHLVIAGTDLCTNQGCKSLKPLKHKDTRFEFYFYLAAKQHLQALGKGTTFLELGGRELGAFELIQPPNRERGLIANFLDHETAKIDRLIAKQERLIELLKEKRQAVISHAVTKGLYPDAPMKDSGVEWLGEIPAHWEARLLSTLSDKITNGYVGPTRDLFVDEGVMYLQSLHIKKNRIVFHKPYYVTQDWSQQKAKSILKEGDVLIVQTGDIGQVAVVPKEYEGANCHALIIVSTKKELSGRYLSWVLNSTYGYNSLKAIQTGALHPHLNCEYVRTIRVPLPPAHEQDKICDYIESQLTRFDLITNKAEHQIALLKEHRTSLISAAVTGKIDVRGWCMPDMEPEESNKTATA